MKPRAYSKTKGKPAIETGTLLIAQPFWPEEIYEHSAILVLDHSNQGTTGVMLNKRSNLNIAEALPELNVNHSLFFGGPSDIKTICFLHSNADVPEATLIGDNIFWGGDYQFIKDMILDRRFTLDEIKFYAGLVQWSGGQLEYEIWNSKWWLGNINAGEIFAGSDCDLWTNKLLSTGHLYGLLHDVHDPSMN